MSESIASMAKSESEVNLEEKSWHLLSLLLKTGHPLHPQHLSSQCRLFNASPSFIRHVISLPSSPLSVTDYGLVAPSPVAVFALARFFKLSANPIGFRDLEPIVLRKRKRTMDDLIEFSPPFFLGGRDQKRLAISNESYADTAKAKREGLIGSGTEREREYVNQMVNPALCGEELPTEAHMEEYPTLNRNLSEEIAMRVTESIDGGNRVSIQELDVAPSNEVVDCSSAFTTEEIFPTRDDLVNWARAVGKENGFVLIIMKSDGGGPKRRRTRITLGCDRSGKYRPYKNELAHKATRSKKCECPFRLKGRPLENGKGWKVMVSCGFHNHERLETLVGHPYVGRLSSEEMSLVEEMAKNMVKPKSILLTLKDHNEGNCTTINQIYSACQKVRKAQKPQNRVETSDEISGT